MWTKFLFFITDYRNLTSCGWCPSHLSVWRIKRCLGFDAKLLVVQLTTSSLASNPRHLLVLMAFNGISTSIGYLLPEPFYPYIIYMICKSKFLGWWWLGFMANLPLKDHWVSNSDMYVCVYINVEAFCLYKPLLVVRLQFWTSGEHWVIIYLLWLIKRIFNVNSIH